MASRRQSQAARAAAFALLLPLADAARSQAAACLAYEPQVVSIEGRLELKLYPGGPHYKSIEGGDMPEPTWILTPRAPICLDEIPGDDWNRARSGIEFIQVLPRMAMPHGVNGHVVRVEGTLYRPRSGHPHSAIVLRATAVTP